tara:strand:- start:7407 stop:8657 length:1251 start_codon:yes stop_codon:yes gene_type:complete
MPLSIPQQTVADDLNRFKVLITGRRFGKTHLCIRELCKSASKNAKSINWYIAPSYRMAKQITWVQLVNRLSELKWIKTKNEAELTCTLKNGSIIALKGADSPDSLRGVGLDFVVMDEFQDIPTQAWTEVIRPTLSDRQGRALFCGTPKGVGSWSHKLYTQALYEKNWNAWQFTTVEGGNVPAEEVESARRDLDDKTFAQEYLATFNTYSGVVAYNFEYKETVKPCIDPLTTIIHVGQDFNLSPMSSVIAQVSRNSIHVFDEIHMLGSNTDEVVEELKVRYPHSQVIVYPDPASRQKKTSAGGRTDFSILQNAGFTVKSRTFHTAVRDRVNSLNALLKTATGERRLFIDPKCKHTIESLQRLTYKEGTNQIDKDSGLDHFFDSLSYMVDYLFPIKRQQEQDDATHWTFGATTNKNRW